MRSHNFFIFPIVVLFVINFTTSQEIIQLPSNRPEHLSENNLYCDGWRLSVETGNAGVWSLVPSECTSYVADYMTGDRYLSDSEFISAYSLAFAQSVENAGNGMNVWIFDIDETLLSNLPYYADSGFGFKFDETTWDEWVAVSGAPALPASLKLYNELKLMGFSLILLTGRDESQRNMTEKNLLSAGYRDWEKLILRQYDDKDKPATEYKSEQRSQLIEQGYRIVGSSGDQWSDLNGYATGQRSFKLPNPMYYIS